MIALVKLPEFMEQEKFAALVERFPTFVANPNTRIGVQKLSYKVLEEGEYFSSEVVLQGNDYYRGDERIECYNVFSKPRVPMVELSKNYGLVDIEKFAKLIIGVSFKILEVYGG